MSNPLVGMFDTICLFSCLLYSVKTQLNSLFYLSFLTLPTGRIIDHISYFQVFQILFCHCTLIIACTTSQSQYAFFTLVSECISQDKDHISLMLVSLGIPVLRMQDVFLVEPPMFSLSNSAIQNRILCYPYYSA